MTTRILRRSVRSPRNSLCGSARLSDLDWSHWFTDVAAGSLYLHVRGTHPRDATWHRVFCRHANQPRLAQYAGRLVWLIDRPSRPHRANALARARP